jgi:hypothetical protein
MIMKYPGNFNQSGTHLEPATTMCKGFVVDNEKVTRKPGENIQVTLEGSATHGGGGCQFGIARDQNGPYKLLMTTDVSCPIVKDWTVPIPSDAPSCKDCIFAWGWVPKDSENPEYYMNCARITIDNGNTANNGNGNNGGFFNNLPEMKFYNFGGNPTVHKNAPNGGSTLGLAEGLGGAFKLTPGNEKSRSRRATISQTAPTPALVNNVNTGNPTAEQQLEDQKQKLQEIINGYKDSLAKSPAKNNWGGSSASSSPTAPTPAQPQTPQPPIQVDNNKSTGNSNVNSVTPTSNNQYSSIAEKQLEDQKQQLQGIVSGYQDSIKPYLDKVNQYTRDTQSRLA